MAEVGEIAETYLHG